VTLRCEEVVAGYGRVVILPSMTLDVGEGECLALIGKNGMGKTTFLKALLGLATRSGGRVTILGKDVSRWHTHDIVRLGVSYTPQELPIFEDLTVDENLRVSGLRTKDYTAARAQITQIFPRLGERLRQKAGTLSGGERKMLLLGRALLPRPGLILLDEISEGLQPSARDVLAEALNSYREETGCGILLVEQNLQFALGLAQRFAVLSNGVIVNEGPVTDDLQVDEIKRHLTL
jgi:ABC-type branched-subunit amino acid transport system ATPase component